MPVLIYDGDCGFCRWCVDLGHRHLPVMPRVSAWQRLDLAEYGLTRDEVTTSVQLVGPRGLRASGARAVAVLLLVQPALWWKVAGTAMLVPPLSWLAAAGYHLVARYRHHLRVPGAPACAVPRDR
ncbi:hypothetical protein Sru01_40490 [Sphaerisporangium rufum]|uniref:DUF393 domain-containing protein n=1 Tax=Sphaerisporangium rufum TaxID=1381558 RepID=A0A919R3L7_9ACTN|nr:hypothetical protein Sru01_40490 [Sphaerisporangium rufum]